MFMGAFVLEKYVLFDPIQIGRCCFIGILFQTNYFTDSIEKFLGFGFIFIDILIYRDILRDTKEILN
jgi:hypothetical protein